MPRIAFLKQDFLRPYKNRPSRSNDLGKRPMSLALPLDVMTRKTLAAGSTDGFLQGNTPTLHRRPATFRSKHAAFG